MYFDESDTFPIQDCIDKLEFYADKDILHHYFFQSQLEVIIRSQTTLVFLIIKKSILSMKKK